MRIDARLFQQRLQFNFQLRRDHVFNLFRVAMHVGVTGWVKNLVDGRVETLAEGSEPALEQFVRELREHFHRYVRHVDVEWEEPTGEFAEFGVRY